ncbi:hypothetical protein [Streptomyces sp. NPDC005181]
MAETRLYVEWNGSWFVAVLLARQRPLRGPGPAVQQADADRGR